MLAIGQMKLSRALGDYAYHPTHGTTVLIEAEVFITRTPGGSVGNWKAQNTEMAFSFHLEIEFGF